MPEPGENESKEDFMHRCVPMAMDEGMENDQAVAVCMQKFEKKDFNLDAEAIKADIADFLKRGARHNRSDNDALQAIHDGAVTLGAICEPKAETWTIPMMAFDAGEEVLSFGAEVKALGDGKLGGYLVRFGDPATPDLTGDFFTAETDFGDFEQADVYYHHGLDEALKRRKLSKGDLHKDDVGVWIETQLQMRDEYEKAIYEMAEAGKLGWSSGTAPHLVEREQKEAAMWIKSWPLGLDASLTPTPAEPRNEAITLKSYLENMQKDAAEVKAGEDSPKEEAEQQTEEVIGTPTNLENTEVPKMELTEERLQELITSAAKTGAEEAIKALPAINPNPGVNIVVDTDEADQPWRSAGEFFKAVKDAAVLNREDVRLKALKGVGTGATESVPSEGGYLVHDQFAPGILDRMYSVGALLSRVATDPVTGNSMTYTAIDESSRVVGSAYGGVRGYWLAEAGTKTSSKPAFRQFTLKLKKIAALAYATDELLEDAGALQSWLTRTVPDVLRWQVEDSIINGDGVGKPLGILSSNCLETLLRIDATEVDATDIANMWSRRWTGANDYVWLMHPSVFPQLINLTIGNFPIMMPNNNMRGGEASNIPTIYGRPVLELEYCQTLGTAGDIILASLSQYQTITKGGVQAASSIHVAFTTDETAFRFVYRIDGQPSWYTDLTPLHGSADVSPFIVLGASV